MFQGNELNLQKFKAIINSVELLQRFKDTLMPHRDRIKRELQDEDPLKMDLIRSQTYKAKLGEETEMEREFRKMNLTRKSSFLPLTFEGMMESFGINLQRKTLYEKFY